MSVHDDLRAAITAVAADTEGADADMGILVDFIVISQWTRFNDDGNEETAYYMLFPDGQLTHHRAMGLAEYGRQRLIQQMYGSAGGSEE